MYKYLNPNLITVCMKADLSKISEEEVYIGSSVDVLYLTEQLKITENHQKYSEYFTNLFVSNIYWAELDKEVFIDNAFVEIDDYGHCILEGKIENWFVHPHHTCNHILMKPNDKGCYWDEEVYVEMCEYL